MDAPVIYALAYTAGLLSILAPCSFALLPSYITFYLNRDDDGESAQKGAANGALMTVGGGLVRGGIGLLAILGIKSITSGLTYFSLAVGALLVVMGALLLSGRDVSIPLPVKLNKRKGFLGVFAFGAMYSIASFGCTAAIFIGLIAAASTLSPLAAVASVSIYVVGMGTLLIPLTIAISTSRTMLLGSIKKFLPHVRLASGVVMAAVGVYLILYNIRII
jgi:cytochrome c biogenesis protein CcdA